MLNAQATFQENISTILFGIAILHTFLVNKIRLIAYKYEKDSLSYHFWHLLSEVEIVFGFWACLFLIFLAMSSGVTNATNYLESLNFTEPMFVFVVMCIASTRPVIYLAETIITGVSHIIPTSSRPAFYISALIIGPLLGSFITEPAAMTVTTLVLLKTIYKQPISLRLKYATLSLLFVNISIGGALTHFAAPPVLMVASKWNWDTSFMFETFGLKAIVAIIASTLIYAFIFRKELDGSIKKTAQYNEPLIPRSWSVLLHLIFLALVVHFAHQPKVFLAIYFLFIGFMMLTQRDQEGMKVKAAFRVSFFLSGLICLGTMQAWWLKIVLAKMESVYLLFGAAALTSITDNAALTYMGSLVDLSDASKYALVAGAVAGGGLTVIANAPNPVAFSILGDSFGKDGIRAFSIFLWALIPTSIAIMCFLFL